MAKWRNRFIDKRLTYYFENKRPLSARGVRDAELAPQLRSLSERNYSVYGRRKQGDPPRRPRRRRDQVARLMRVEGIRGASRAKKRFTTRADPAASDQLVQPAAGDVVGLADLCDALPLDKHRI